MWLGFPSHAELWEDDLAPAQAEVAALARALAGPGKERVRLLVARRRGRGGGARPARRRRRRRDRARPVRRHLAARHRADLPRARRRFAAAAFRFNGWGGKYVLEGDDSVAEQIAAAAGAPLDRARLRARRRRARPRRLRHGADHPPVPAEPQPQPRLERGRRRGGARREALGAREVLWLGDGPAQRPHRRPRRQPRALRRARAWSPARWPGARTTRTPRSMTPRPRRWPACADARAAAPLTVVRIASPGRIEATTAPCRPASHMNFVIANGAVIAPVYEARAGAFAARGAAEPLPRARGDRPAVARPAERRRLVPLHHPAGAGMMARTLTLARDPERPTATTWPPTSPSTAELIREAAARRRAGDPAVGAVPGALLLRARRRSAGSPRPSLARASLRHRAGAAGRRAGRGASRSRSSSARGRTISTAW